MTGNAGPFRGGGDIDAIVFSILNNQGSCTDNAVPPQGNVVAQGDIDPQKTILPDRHAPGNHHMGRDETIIHYTGMMPDMVAAPQRHIVSNGDKRLNRVVLQNKTIVSHLKVRKGSGPGTDITDQRISLVFGRPILFRSQGIDFCITQRNEHWIFGGRIMLFQILESHHRQATEPVGAQIFPIHAKRGDLILAVMFEIKMRDFRDFSRSKYYNMCH